MYSYVPIEPFCIQMYMYVCRNGLYQKFADKGGYGEAKSLLPSGGAFARA